MELRLLRAQFPHSMMGQLFMNGQLLCIYIGSNNQKGWTPIAGLPDGRYCLHKPGDENKQGSIQVTNAPGRKPLVMKSGSHEELTGYDKNAPLYLSWGHGQQQLSELAKQNIETIMAAIENGEDVHLTIFSQYLG